MKEKIKNIINSFRKRSYSLNELDLKLLPYLNFRNGFFIEAGANDGVAQSNTLYYEKYLGWQGLLIEAIPVLADQCRQNRPACIMENCALVSSGFAEKTVELEYYNLMSLVKGGLENESEEEIHKQNARKIQADRKDVETYVVSVPAKTLSAVLDLHGITRIDFFSLDVEGYEANVLRGIDFNRHAPKYILMETRHSKRSEIETILSPYYDLIDELNSNENYADILFRSRL